jgi:hypothetical protein
MAGFVMTVITFQTDGHILRYRLRYLLVCTLHGVCKLVLRL